MQVTIRKASVEDAAEVVAVINTVIAEGGLTLFDKPFSVDQERRFIASLDERSALFVAQSPQGIVGVQSVDGFSDYSASGRHVATIGTWLLPEARGSGAATLLARESFRFARANGYEKVVIQVLAENARALAFYRKLGFQSIGTARRHVKLNGRYHDEVFLERFF
ncbi:MAG TPA: GNAT family protein [Acidobacteriota bacterium]|nr:GNAT family protein [Acidobacteriota bacterium]